MRGACDGDSLDADGVVNGQIRAATGFGR